MPQNKITASHIWEWYREGFESSSGWRKEAIKDCKYYDNDQFSEEDKETLRERGQPVITINRVKPTIDLVIGAESKARVDFYAAPRTDQDVQDAAISTECLKYVMDQNEGEFVCSGVFEGQVKAGWGIIEVSENDNPFKEIIKVGEVEKNDIIWDPYSVEYDLSDAKYIIRHKWLDLETAVAKFPKHKLKLESAVSDQENEELIESPYPGTEDKSDRPGVKAWPSRDVKLSEWVDKGRRRVKIIECWYKTPSEVWIVENEITGDVDEFDPKQAMNILFQPGVRVRKVNMDKVRVCIVCGSDVFEDNFSPYRHNEYPFVPFWGYRKETEKTPYGLIRQIRDMQDEVNKRRAKAMHHLNTKQIIADTDAIDMAQNDWRKVIEESAKPNGVIKLNPLKPNARFEIVNQGEMIREQFMFEEEAKKEIEEVSGVSGEMKGMQTNATSGRAIIARQVQSMTMLGKIFDNYRRSRLILGNLIWGMIQQYFNKPKQIRVLDKTGGYKFFEINKYMTDGEQILIQNDITKAKVDIKIDEQVYHASIREALLEQMMEMITRLPPDIGLMMLDIVVSYSDLPKRDEMVQRIQQIQGLIMMKQQVQQQEAQMGQGSSPGGDQSLVGDGLPAEAKAIESQMMGGV